VTAAVTAAGFDVRNTLIWNKNTAQYGAFSAQYKQKHEPFLYLHLKGKSPRWYGPGNEVTVWDCARSGQNTFHPTQKPVSIACRAMTNSSRIGDLVLDACAGGGSTLVAAKMLRRRAIGIEISREYCDVIVSRLQQECFSLAAVPVAAMEQEQML
jgi:DNA modification methylase